MSQIFSQSSMARALLGVMGVCILISCSSRSLAPSLSSVDPSVRAIQLASRDRVEATGAHWIVSTQGQNSSRISESILKSGGNLIDAAIAASFAIGVERPHSTGIGGGGFFIFHEGKSGKNLVFDFRERAPHQARSALFLDADGEVVPDLSVTGALSVGVPGLVRGLKHVHAQYGKLPWSQVLEPAAVLAEKGFPIYPALALALISEASDLARFEDSRSIFLHSDGTPLKEGEVLIQKDLSKTIREIGKNPESFYRGRIAKAILKTIRKNRGILDAADLKNYAVKERSPVEADWKGYHVVSMPPPSSGGIHVIQILKMLEQDPLRELGFQSVQSEHRIAQAMQQAFADRARYLGDPDFVKVPVKSLTSDSYLQSLRKRFDLTRARTQAQVSSGKIDIEKDHFETTHLSLMDEFGNAIVSTQTINGWFGSKMVAKGTGIVLNNEMDDFSAKVGASNIFGATSSSTANQVAPGKTPLSSMSPTLIFKDGQPILALGAPGGTRIITAVAQTILNYLVYQQDLYTSVASPRIHQQWSPDELRIENQEIPLEWLRGLSGLGWKIKRIPSESHVMAVAKEKDGFRGVSDPRDAGICVGY